MFDTKKNFMLKAKIKTWFQHKLGITDLLEAQQAMERRQLLNSRILHQLMPEVYPIPDLKDLPILSNSDHGSKASLAVHKNDLMFLGNLENSDDAITAFRKYFKLGVQTAEMLRDYSVAYDVTVAEVLDFGTGYGRVSRFLPFVFGKKVNVNVSEVKKEALDFLGEQMKFNCIFHGQSPVSFKTDKVFDLIFAGSVFTHLPEANAILWLNKLLDHTNENGLLIFSIRNLRHYDYPAHESFVYRKMSEEKGYQFVEGTIKDEDAYGSALIADEWIKKHITKFNYPFELKYSEFGKRQDLVIIQKKS